MILVLGGTARSGEVVRQLLDEGHTVHVTVTRDSARRLYPELDVSRIHVGARDRASLRALVERLDPRRIVDVTHPFADTISRHAIAVSRRLSRPYAYLRRPSGVPESADGLHRVETWREAVRTASRFGTVLLTIGINHLESFVDRLASGDLYARVIPRPDSVAAAREAGVAPDRVIGVWPPVPEDLNRALIREYGIDLVVSKASGPDGGVPQKWRAVRAEGAALLVVNRPSVAYDRAFDSTEALLDWVRSPVTP